MGGGLIVGDRRRRRQKNRCLSGVTVYEYKNKVGLCQKEIKSAITLVNPCTNPTGWGKVARYMELESHKLYKQASAEDSCCLGPLLLYKISLVSVRRQFGTA